MKAKGAPRDFVPPVVRVTQTKALPAVTLAASSSGAGARPRPFLVHALPLRRRKRIS